MFDHPAGTAKSRFPLFGLRVASLAAIAFAVVALVVLLITMLTPTAPLYVVEITAEDRSLVVQASFDADAEVVAVQRVADGAVPGRVLELWRIAEGAEVPVSLGVLPEGTQARGVILTVWLRRCVA